MDEMTVTAEPTPNPNAYKFSTNRQLNPDPTRSYTRAGLARDDPVATKLFTLPGVVGVMILNDFCSVNQDGSVPWEELIPQVEGVLREAYGN